MKATRIYPQEAGVVSGCLLTLLACLAALIASDPPSWQGWTLALVLSIGVAVGLTGTTNAIARLLEAPPTTTVTLRRGAFVRGLVRAPSLAAAVLGGLALGDVFSGTEVDLTGAAAGISGGVAALTVRSWIVWRTAAWVERRWPVQLVEGPRELRWVGRPPILALHLPAPAPSVRPAGP